MKYYLKVGADGTILDAIDYAYGDYVEFEIDTLPVGVNGGWWKLENGQLVEHPALKPKDETEILRSEITAMELAIAELAEMMLGGK